MTGSEDTLGGRGPTDVGNVHVKERPLMERALPSIRSPWMAMGRKMWTKMFVTFCVLLMAIVMGILSSM